jgi:coenzyme F420-reducing hydrogenase delta subunit
MARVKEILDEIQLNGERLHMETMSAAMAGKFVEAATEMDRLIERLGPNPLRAPGGLAPDVMEEGRP